MANEYDIVRAFQLMEEDLIASMKRNLSRHLKEEEKEGFDWSMWQAEQLNSLKVFQKENPKLFKKYFSTIDKDIDEVLKLAYESGKAEEEIKMLEALKKGKITKTKTSFFKPNSRKLKALIDESTTGIKKARLSILRYTNDQYRKIIYNAQVFANTGATTPQKAIDMATKNFMAAGINNIQYSNGNRVNIASYVEMAIKTSTKRAQMQGEGAKRDEWGLHTVLVHNRGGGCPFCTKFQGKVFIDDVWSSGTKKESEETGYPLLSHAINEGLFHPRCKDRATTYFPGLNSEPRTPTKEELKEKKKKYMDGQKLNYINHNIEKYKRLELGSIDKENIEKYHKKKLEWQEYKKRFKANSDEKFYKMTNNKNDGIIESKTLSLHECKDLIEKYGIIFVEEDLKTLDNQLLFENTKRLDELLNKYPIMQEYIKGKTMIFGAEHFRDKSTVAAFWCGMDNQRLSINMSKLKYANYDKFIEMEAKDINIFHSMPCADEMISIYSITHEFGHFIESKFIDDYNKAHLAEFLNMKTRALNASSVSKSRKILQNWQEKITDEVAKDIAEIAKKANPNFKFADNLSKYGYKNSLEFFAECFANMECGKMNELGKAMEEYLKQRGIK